MIMPCGQSFYLAGSSHMLDCRGRHVRVSSNADTLICLSKVALDSRILIAQRYSELMQTDLFQEG
jgi:hypothetical protein